MQYLSVPFEPPVDRNDATVSASNALQNIIAEHSSHGWEFVGVQNHSTIVPGTSGCLGLGAMPPYPKTMSIVVFRK
jgi:hypothetical protein